jgi:hypothetical protein
VQGVTVFRDMTKAFPLAAGWLFLLGGVGPVAAADIRVVATYDYPVADASTFGRGISNDGSIAGTFVTDRLTKGFVRFPDGHFSEPIVAPSDASKGSTYATDINVLGTVVGAYQDSNGFILRNQKYGNFSDTEILGINDLGHMVGIGNGVEMNFPVPGVILSGSRRTTFFAPGASSGLSETFANRVNNFDHIVGYYTTDGAATFHGFYRDGLGKIATLDFPGASDTYLNGINDEGWIVGQYYDTDGISHAFYRIGGIFAQFDYPDAAGTSFNGLNNTGAISGRYSEANGNAHAFIAQITCEDGGLPSPERRGPC